MTFRKENVKVFETRKMSLTLECSFSRYFDQRTPECHVRLRSSLGTKGKSDHNQGCHLNF